MKQTPTAFSILVIGALCAAASWARPAVARPRCYRGGRASRFDLDALAKKSPWLALSEAARKALAARASKETKLGAVDGLELQKTGASRYAGAWMRCKSDTCRLYAGVFALRGGKFRLRKKVELASGWAGSEINATALADVDGDGRRELVVKYYVVATPEPAVGSTNETSLAIFALPTLTSQLDQTIGRGGEATIHEKCTATVRSQDRRCSGRPDLIVRLTCERHPSMCGPKMGDPCKEANTTAYTYDAAKDRWLAPPKKYAQKAADARPWAVIGPSFVAGTEKVATRDAERALRRYQSAGFAAARLHHTGTFSGLRCCYWSVIVDRFATRAEAVALIEKLRKKKLSAYPKRAFRAVRAKR